VSSAPGRWNIAIVAEAPGRLEDKSGKPLVGPASKVLWDELKKYKLHRGMFHVTNVNKCFPNWAKRKTMPPDKAQMLACRQWLNRELKEIDCRLVLALGNNPLFMFTGQQGGIRKLSGEIVWNDSRGLWTVFAVHPSSVLRARSQNVEYFEKGVKVFADVVNRFIKMRRK
jgi:DNA polymerase